MEEDDKGCPMIRMGVSGWVFVLLPTYLGCPGPKAVKRLCVCVRVCVRVRAWSEVLAYWWLNVPQVGVVMVMWPISKFSGPSHIFGADKSRRLKFGMQIDFNDYNQAGLA